jgi:hypothetical protein
MNDSQYDYRDINRALKRKVKAAKKSGNETALMNVQFLDNVSVALDHLVFYWKKNCEDQQEASNAQR